MLALSACTSAAADAGEITDAATEIRAETAAPTVTMGNKSSATVVVQPATEEPTLLPTSEPACEKPGIIEKIEIESDLIPYVLFSNIYLPPCYGENPTEKYPVMMLLHGQSYNESQWVDLGVAGIADQMINEEGYAPFVILLPQEKYYLKAVSDSDFRLAVIDVLLPYVMGQYAVLSERDAWVVGGISRGATWALRMGLIDWDRFSAVGLHSYPGGVTSAVYFWNKIVEDRKPRIYLDSGERDRYLSAAVGLHTDFDLFSIPHEWHLNLGQHDDAYWQEHVFEYLHWYASEWQE